MMHHTTAQNNMKMTHGDVSHNIARQSALFLLNAEIRSFFCFFCQISVSLAFVCFLASLSLASSKNNNHSPAPLPPPFRAKQDNHLHQKRIVPISIQTLHVAYRIDCQKQRVSAKARIVFQPLADGYPMFDLVSPRIQGLKLNGSPLPSNALSLIQTPRAKTTLLALHRLLKKNTSYTLDLAYQVEKKHLRFRAHRLDSFFFWMTDNEGRERRFLEQYAPANFEGDQFQLQIDLSLQGCIGHYQVVTNASQSEEHKPNQSWRLFFPRYFNSSSPFFHFFSSRTASIRLFQRSQGRNIPVLLYGKKRADLLQGVRLVKEVFPFYERLFGAYPHRSLVIRMVDFSQSKHHSMEYAGAIVSNLASLRHELTHMWFGRGVFPANGQAGWLDEAIATWAECGFCSFTWLKKRRKLKGIRSFRDPAQNLTCGSSYRRTTRWRAYRYGMLVLVEMDALLLRHKRPPMLALLKRFYSQHKRKIVSAREIYRFFWEEKVLRKHFQRFVMGELDEKRCFLQ
jgi:hypothetical protein